MVAPMSASGLSPPPAPPTRCAECGSLLTDALVLACGHDLCLGCAAGALRQTGAPGLRAVRCLLCSGVTEICDAAAEALGAASRSAQAQAAAEASSQAQAGWKLRQEIAGYGAGGGGMPQFGANAGSYNSGAAATAYFGNGVAGARPPSPRLAMPPAVRAAYLNAAPAGTGGGSTGSSSPPPQLVRVDVGVAAPPGSRTNVQEIPWRPRGASPAAIVVPVTSISPANTPRRGNMRDNGNVAEPLSLLNLPLFCLDHPDEIPSYFCATCECACVCADCVVAGKHQGHEVMKVNKAHEALRARAGALLDEALALEDDFAVVQDKLSWRRKDVERAAARGRASVRSAFARVRAQLADREAELLGSLDTYEQGSLSRLDGGSSEHDNRLTELRQLQDTLRARCRAGDAVSALNAYAAAKAAISSLRESFRHDELNAAGAPDEFVGLAGSARAELDLHAEGLASLEEAVATLCERGIEFPSQAPARAGNAVMVTRDKPSFLGEQTPPYGLRHAQTRAVH